MRQILVRLALSGAIFSAAAIAANAAPQAATIRDLGIEAGDGIMLVASRPSDRKAHRRHRGATIPDERLLPGSVPPAPETPD